MKKNLPYFAELDGLRGLAALYIFITHFAQGVHYVPTASTCMRGMDFFARYGFLAVDFFFVLSGFLITSLLLLDRRKPHFFHNFYWKRVLRIQPAFLVSVLWLLLSAPHTGRYTLLSLVFLANFAVLFHVNIITPAWSLAIEEQFYLCWPSVLRRFSTATVARLSVLLFFGSAVLRIGVVALMPRHGNLLYTFYRLDGLALGALAACIFITPEEVGPRVARFATLLRSRMLLMIVLGGFCSLPWLAHRRLGQAALPILLTNLAAYQLIAAIAAGKSFRLLRAAPLLFMGEISYGFYLYHSFVLNFAVAHLGTIPLNHPATLALRALGALIVSIGISLVSLYALERPVQRLRRFVLKGRTAEPHPLPANLAGSPVTQAVQSD